MSLLSCFFSALLYLRLRAPQGSCAPSNSCRGSIQRPPLPPLVLPEAARVSYMRPIPAAPPLTRAALMDLPSNFSLAARAETAFGVTAIVSFYRRAWTLPIFVKRLLHSTVVPREIWLVAFASEIEAELVAAYHALSTDAEVLAATAALGTAAPPILFARGGMHLSYFGRFQLALLARTPFTVIFDDDTVPGVQVLHTLLHMAHTAVGAHSVLSARGHHLQWPMMQPFSMSARSPWVLEEDVTGGFWFSPTGLLRLLWRDRPLSLVTSEDSQLCSAVRKYTGRSCLVVPVDPNDSTTTTQEVEYDVRGREGDTTSTTNKMPERTRVTRELFLRGTPIRLREHLRQPHSVLLVVNECWTAGALASASAASLNSSIPPAAWFVALTGACSEDFVQQHFPQGFAQHNWPTLDCFKGACSYENRTYGFFNLSLGTDMPGADRPLDWAVDGAMAMNSLLELLQPRLVVAARSSSPVTLGLALASKFLNIPLLLVGSRGEKDAKLLSALSVTVSPPSDLEAAQIITHIATTI